VIPSRRAAVEPSEAGRCRQAGACRAAWVAPLSRDRAWWHPAAAGEATSRSFGCHVGDRAAGLAGSRVRARASAVVGPARSSHPAPSGMREKSGCWDARAAHRGRLDVMRLIGATRVRRLLGRSRRRGLRCTAGCSTVPVVSKTGCTGRPPVVIARCQGRSRRGRAPSPARAARQRSKDPTRRRRTSVLAGRPGGDPPDAGGGRRENPSVDWSG
jgi:hypothetical protein